MKKNMICIECPNGCLLKVEIKDGKVASVEGHQCEKGEKYAFSEVEKPLRILTSTISTTDDLHMNWIPVRTDKPIPKDKLFEAMEELKKLKIKKPVEVGDIIAQGFLNLDVNLIATRNCH